ncbi:glucarate dehydratase [Burkholderia sp. HI2761]|uniref:glucarate dehydratase family protein n=1 Tax=unclassified Burkholderia TaxID=2613784 RepID=UPI000B7ACD17|nr:MULTISPECIES: glucarate dehydratase family protein [unclassified Burkholderia]MPV61500.1 glucarate dehydratase [Burkholderia sp. BE24]OXJ21445.1 glucarate dehydratase [Burkholderia sp. HI2761]
MKIVAVRVTPIAISDPPLLNYAGVHEPFALRSIIEVEADNGLVGLGETYGDKPVLDHLLRVKDRLVGCSAFDLAELWRVVSAVSADAVRRGLAPGYDTASFSRRLKSDLKAFGAFEVALLDLQARSLGIPMYELLGGAVRRSVPYSAYLFFKYGSGIDSAYKHDPWEEALNAEQLVAQARVMIARYGFGSIKLKAGVFEPQVEIECLHALKQAFPGVPLRIDPNGNWSLETAIRMADLLREDLEYYEDPTPNLETMSTLHRVTGLTLATNMVVTDIEEFRQNIASRAIHVILADHHYWGGLRATQTLAALCDTSRLGVSMHSNSHLGISLMAMTHVAATVPNLTYACDTHYPWQVDEVIKGGKIAIEGGCVALSDKPGLGVELDQDALRALHARYLECGISERDDETQMKRLNPEWIPRRPRY